MRRARRNDATAFPWRIFLTLSALTAALVATLGYSMHVGNRIAREYAPLVEAAKEMKLEATTGHLWFEEILGGDSHEDIEAVWRHLDRSALYIRAMLEGDRSEVGVHVPLKDPDLRRETEEFPCPVDRNKRLFSDCLVYPFVQRRNA